MPTVKILASKIRSSQYCINKKRSKNKVFGLFYFYKLTLFVVLPSIVEQITVDSSILS